MIIKCGTCVFCSKDAFLDVDDETGWKVLKWTAMDSRTRPYIQDAFPGLSAGDREMILNGSHDKCFNEAFGGDDEEG